MLLVQACPKITSCCDSAASVGAALHHAGHRPSRNKKLLSHYSAAQPQRQIVQGQAYHMHVKIMRAAGCTMAYITV